MVCNGSIISIWSLIAKTHSNLSDIRRAEMLQWSTAPDSYIMSRWRCRLVEGKAPLLFLSKPRGFERAQPLKVSHRKRERSWIQGDHKQFRDSPGPSQHPRLAGYQYAAGDSSQQESLSALWEAASFCNSHFSLPTVSRSSPMQRTLKKSHTFISTTITASCFYTNSLVCNQSTYSCFAGFFLSIYS